MLTLIQFNPDERQKPRTFRLAGDRAQLIGRRHGDVQLMDSRISREHAEVSIQNGTWVIRDLGSSNGTWVNGDRIEGLCELEQGDRLVVGRITLIVGQVEADTVAAIAPRPSAAPASRKVAASDADAQAAEWAQDAKPAVNTADASAAEDSAIDLDLDLDGELDLAAVDIEVDESHDASNPETDADVSSIHGEPARHETQSETTNDADLLDLSDTANDASVDLDASSLAPDRAAELEADAEVVEAQAEMADFDDLGGEDEYGAADHFVTPAVRPESPLDNATPRDDFDLDVVEAGDKASSDDSGFGDVAPPVVGLSLDMPAPKIETAADLEARLNDLETAPDELDGAAEDTGLDYELPDDSPIAELEDEQGQRAPASPPATVATAAGTAIATSATAPATRTEPDWVDSEDQQELDATRSGRGPSRKKALAVLVLIALAAGGGFWAINANQTNPPIAGIAPDSHIPAPPLARNGSPATSAPSPRAIPSPPPPAIPATPPPIATNQNLADTPAAATPQADAFGQSPTLTAAPTRPTPNTPVALTPPPAPARPAEPTNSPPLAAADADSIPQPPTVEAAAETPHDNAGPALAMIDPTPTFEADLLRLPDQPVAPPVAAPSSRRIAFVIDASGSMVDSMNQGALTWLQQRLESLTDQDEFTVLFFRSNEVIEIPPTGLRRADRFTREQALAWISPDAGNIRPRGKSEPLSALEQAQRYRPTDIYILSDDKFGQRQASAASIQVRDLEPLLRDSPATVHTVQFFYPNQDDSQLEAIAQHFGGTYEFVKEPPFDLNPNADLGVDLLGISR